MAKTIFKEDKEAFLEELCKLLQMTTNLGHPNGNPLRELRYIKDGGEEYARPIFEDGGGENGYYDINITGDACMGILNDVYKRFIVRY